MIAFGFETCIKIILPLVSRLINVAVFQSDAASAHWCRSLVYRFQSVSPDAGALVWFSCSQAWNWMMQITVMSCCSNSFCQTFHAAGDFCFPVHHTCARALSCCDTRLVTSHQTWPPNRPDLSSVVYRLLRIIHLCIYQKQQRRQTSLMSCGY